MSNPLMRAKMKVTAVDKFPNQNTLHLQAVTGIEGAYPPDGVDEDNTFARWTPAASLTISITNPDLVGKFKQGQAFYVDFTEVK